MAVTFQDLQRATIRPELGKLGEAGRRANAGGEEAQHGAADPDLVPRRHLGVADGAPVQQDPAGFADVEELDVRRIASDTVPE
ncbi:MAG: hypothetical protein ACO2YV_13960, partial [Pseudomonadales bacterium]